MENRLAEVRAERGWKKARLIYELRMAADRHGQTLPKDDSLGRRIAAWENQGGTVGDFYRDLVCEVYGMSAAELGIAHESSGTIDTGGSSLMKENITNLISQITESSTTDEAIDQLGRATVSLAEAHTQAPATRLLKEVLRLHGQAREFLQTKHRLSQERELYRIESELLAHACLLLGDLKQDQFAERCGTAALVYAREAGVNQALAWTVLAKTLRWEERFVESAEMARQGFDCSPLRPVKIQLASQEANAAALLGDARRAHEALRRAEETAAITAPDSGVSAWSFPTPRQAIFALSVATFTGDTATALRAAAQADAAWHSGEPRVLATWAQIRVGAAIAHLVEGSLDGATEEVTPVLTLPPELRVATVTAYISRLDRGLAHTRFHGSRIVRDLRENLQQFNAGALPSG